MNDWQPDNLYWVPWLREEINQVPPDSGRRSWKPHGSLVQELRLNLPKRYDPDPANPQEAILF